MIDVERLLILREVARHGSKAAAARALQLSEPTVAHHLRALERRAGVPLTMRAGRVTRLTPTGEALVQHADAIAASLEDAERSLHRHADLQVGQLRIAAFTSFCATVLPRPLAQFAHTYPGVEIGLEETETDPALDLLRSGAADLVIGFSDAATPPPVDIPTVPLGRDEYLAILPETHPLAGRAAIDMGALAHERWISGCVRCRTHLVAHADEAGFVPHIAFVTEDYIAAQRLIAEGLGVALLTRMALDASPAIPGIVAVPTRPDTYRDIFLALPRDAAPAAEAFASLLVTGL
ncbi:LysR family transcriptional regulator [Demequina silvatica]|uniref:LysR family transcriptional regulator n=1 Tax=Demequina silvatica TaxID=1638988 RepID=UPI0007805037|nr:LysR substrate-binding domain-containing protein [Demequina silvatica]